MIAPLTSEERTRLPQTLPGWRPAVGRDALAVLQRISANDIDIAPGQMIGIVGQSGSGKSTLAKLVQRLYTPETGRVYVDGVETGRTVVSSTTINSASAMTISGAHFRNPVSSAIRSARARWRAFSSCVARSFISSTSSRG